MLALQAQGSQFVLQKPHEESSVWSTLVIPTLGRQIKADPRGLLGHQPRILG